MGQLYATVKQLTASTELLRQDNADLRSELKHTREWLFKLNNLVAELAQSTQQSTSPRSPPTLDKNEDCGWP